MSKCLTRLISIGKVDQVVLSQLLLHMLALIFCSVDTLVLPGSCYLSLSSQFIVFDKTFLLVSPFVIIRRHC